MELSKRSTILSEILVELLPSKANTPVLAKKHMPMSVILIERGAIAPTCEFVFTKEKSLGEEPTNL